MEPKEISKLITEDPDIFIEDKIRCRMCGRMVDDNNKYCPICASPLRWQQRKITKTPQIVCPIKVDDFDWEQFSRDAERHGEDLEIGDFDRNQATFSATVPIRTKYPIKADVGKFVDENDLYRHLENLEQICPSFLNDMSKIAKDHLSGFWEIEHATDLYGYHGKSDVTRVTADLNDAEIDEITDLEQDNDGIVYMQVTFYLPFYYREFQTKVA